MQTFQRPFLKIIDEKLIDRVIDEAFHVLQTVGIRVELPEAVKLLDDAGGIPKENGRIRAPLALVEKCLESAPKSMMIYDRDGNPALDLAGDAIHFNPGSSALKIYHWQTQRYEKPVTTDLVRLAQLTHFLPYIQAQSTALVPADVPDEIADRYRLFVALQHSTKPVITGTFSTDGFAVMKEMLRVFRNSDQELAQKPLAIFDCCPTSPLKWSALTCRNVLECAQSGIPAEIVPMPMIGATAPGTLAGALVQITAENLSGVVLCQIANRGAPVIWGGSPTAFDQRFGSTPMGAMESMMINAANAAVGKKMGLPTHAYMGLSDSRFIDAQSGLEAGIGAVMAALSGVNVISGPGMLDFQTAHSPEKLVIDNEICGMALRLTQGVQLRVAAFTEDLFGNIDDGEHFLTSARTLQWMREEFDYPSEIISRTSESDSKDTIGDRAHRRIQFILKENDPPECTVDQLKALRDIMTFYAREYGMQLLPEL